MMHYTSYTKLLMFQTKRTFYKAAHQFDETSLFESVLAGSKNVLNGKHAKHNNS